MKKINDFRLIGFLYLLVIILAGFSQGYVRTNLHIDGDPLATATKILENENLFRLGLLADLTAFILDAVISVLLYQLLKPYGKTLALISSSLRILAHPAIGTINLLNHYMALHVLQNSDILNSFEASQIEAFSYLFMDAHTYGYLLAGGFFGVHCALLGIQLYRSGLLPKILGVLMGIAAIGYLMETFGNFLFPGNEYWLAWTVGIAAALGEVELALYLLIKGKKKTSTTNLSLQS